MKGQRSVRSKQVKKLGSGARRHELVSVRPHTGANEGRGESGGL